MCAENLSAKKYAADLKVPILCPLWAFGCGLGVASSIKLPEGWAVRSEVDP